MIMEVLTFFCCRIKEKKLMELLTMQEKLPVWWTIGIIHWSGRSRNQISPCPAFIIGDGSAGGCVPVVDLSEVVSYYFWIIVDQHTPNSVLVQRICHLS